MAIYVPDEKGELTLLDQATDAVAGAPLPTGELGAAFGKMFLTLIVLLLLLFISYWFLRKLIRQRMEKGASDSSIQILEKRMLSPKTTLYLVEIDQKKVLIAESQLEIRRLDSSPLE
jgi:flagellar biogenesis protein FliO